MLLLLQLGRLVCFLASLNLKWNAFVFLRYLPLGYRFLPKIFTSLAVYVSTYYLILLYSSPPPKSSRKNGRGPTREARATPLLALLTGVPPRTSSTLLHGAVLFLRLLPVLFSLDFMYRAYYLHPSTSLAFSRVGHTTASSARVLLRSPTSQTPFNFTYSSSSSSLTVSVESLMDSTDFTTTVYLQDLLPDTVYTYSSSLGHAGSLTTTRSEEFLKKFTILSSSCLKPGWPYVPWEDSRAIRGVDALNGFVESMERKPEAMLFLGDWIYSDLPITVAPLTKSYYRQLYRQIYASPSWTRTLLDIPWIHMFDDHEILNDYAESLPGMEGLYTEAIDPFAHYHLAANPPPLPPSSSGSPPSSSSPLATRPKNYTFFSIGNISFFLLDTRSYRSPPPPRTCPNSTAGFSGGDRRTMLGADQLRDVKAWAARTGEEGKMPVLVSGVPVTRNWSGGGDEMDSWAGFLDEREEVLQAMWEVGGGVVMSGDRHEHATTLLPPPLSSAHRPSSTIVEFSTSPLSFFYQPLVRDYLPHPPTDIPVHVHWKGSSKFGVFDFDTSGKEWKVDFGLVVDGRKAWGMEWVWEGRGTGVGVGE